MKKGLFVFMAALLLIFTGCSTPDGNGGELDLISGEYRAVWEENYAYETPTRIDSLSDWEAFLERHPAQSANEDVLEQEYGEEFFEKHIIYVYIKSEASGSNRLTVKGARRNGDELELIMERFVPEEGTDDLATRICVFGIKREDIKNISVVTSSIVENEVK